MYSPRSGYGYGESAKQAASRFKKHKGCGAQICKVSAGNKRILDHLGDLEMFVRTSISGRAQLSPAVPQTVDVDGLDIASPETRPSKFLHFPWQNHRNDRFLCFGHNGS